MSRERILAELKKKLPEIIREVPKNLYKKFDLQNEDYKDQGLNCDECIFGELLNIVYGYVEKKNTALYHNMIESFFGCGSVMNLFDVDKARYCMETHNKLLKNFDKIFKEKRCTRI